MQTYKVLKFTLSRTQRYKKLRVDVGVTKLSDLVPLKLAKSTIQGYTN